MRHLRLHELAGVLLLVTSIGCNTSPQTDYSQINLQDVTGTITLDGQPLANAVVTFHDEADGTFSYGLTDSAGAYRLQFDSQKEGCKPGKKRVEVSTTRKILGLNSTEEGGDPDAKRPAEKIPERFNKKSELIVEVSPTARQHDFQLSGK